MHQKHYGMATVVSVVFKVIAWLWVIAAIVGAANAGAAANDLGANGASQGGAIFAVLAGGAVLACTSAFFGYVISFLRDVARNGQITQRPLVANQWAPPSPQTWGGPQTRPGQTF